MTVSPRLVVGVDGSPGAEQALRWAVREAATLPADRPVTVLATLAFGPLGRPPELDALETGHLEDLLPAAQSLLNKAVAQVAPSEDVSARVVISTATVYDEPVSGLLELLGRADVLVLGSRGWGRLRRMVLGSVASQCLQLHPGNVVVVRGTVPPSDNRAVVVGADGSPDSLCALRWAAEFAVRHHTPLRVVRACSAPTSLHPSLRSVTDRQRELDRARADLRRFVGSTLAKVYGSDELHVTTDLVDDTPTAGLTAASEDACQLLVLGRGGPTALRRRPIGSTALSCTLNAGSSVAVIGPEPSPTPNNASRESNAEESS